MSFFLKTETKIFRDKILVEEGNVLNEPYLIPHQLCAVYDKRLGDYVSFDT